jgi:hypothetical protein
MGYLNGDRKMKYKLNAFFIVLIFCYAGAAAAAEFNNGMNLFDNNRTTVNDFGDGPRYGDGILDPIIFKQHEQLPRIRHQRQYQIANP